MKHKMLAVVLALTVMSWAQTATQTVPSTPQQSAAPADQTKCPCCDKMATADKKDAPACCANHDMQAKEKDSKEVASCCAGKDAMSGSGKEVMSCVRDNKDKTIASCCKDACGKDGCRNDKTAVACCTGKDGKGCCSGKKSEKTASSCCKKELHS